MSQLGNIVVILADEHSPRFLGCSGHDVVQTPNLDALAAAGARFSNAYTPSPICVPARASLATGQWVHRLGNWGSAEPYRGEVPSWAHLAREAGFHTASIGKLHFGSADEDHGFVEEHIPMHVVNGVGWVQGLDRREAAEYPEAAELAAGVGIGESTYVAYDRQITERTVAWLDQHGNDEQPWVLFVSFVSPHYPLTVPRPYWDLYEGADLAPEIPSLVEHHPRVAGVASYFDYHSAFDDDLVRAGRRAYFGLCSFVDDQIGEVLAALDATAAGHDATVIYTSDHGDLAGNRGLWCKSHMFEDSVGVPLLVRGPGVEAGTVCATPVGLVDVHATIVDLVGVIDPETDGDSLVRLAAAPNDDGRVTFSEYHDGGSVAGYFMVRTGQWKYVYHVGAAPQLFDLDDDPDELVDLGTSAHHVEVRAELEAVLRDIVDPDDANRRALADQQRLVDRFGGLDALHTAFRFNHTPTPDLS